MIRDAAPVSAKASPSSRVVLGVDQSLGGRAWRPRLEDDRLALTLAQRLNVPEIIGRILVARGADPADGSDCLAPTLRALLPDPSMLRDMDKAAARLARAVRAGEAITVFGDYDVDGATSSALLHRFLTAVGGRVEIYIPDRAREGYGPNAPALRRMAEAGVSVVVTVDCGTLAFEALEEGSAAGLDIIVVDHHQAEAELPRAHAVVNPNRLDDLSGYGQLAAVGVAFLLAVAVNRTLRAGGWYGAGRCDEPDLKTFLDLVALGTVCDVVPLTGVNRALVAQGLKVLRRQGNPGLAALADVAAIDQAPGTYELGYLLGPRINAGGRIGAADLGARLLITRDPEEAAGLASHLDRLNEERKVIEAAVQDEAMARLDRRFATAPLPPVIVVADRNWHQGVVGIVASRLKDRYQRPVIVIAVDEKGVGKGSGRSIAGVDLGAAVVAALEAGFIRAGGGHAMAAGLTVDAGKVTALADFLSERLAPEVAAAAGARALKIDGLLAPGAVTPDFFTLIEGAGPYGAGNPEPVFVLPSVRIAYADRVGQDHVKCRLKGDDGVSLDAIFFRAADRPAGAALLEARGGRLHVAGKVRRDRWRGGEAMQFVIEDVAGLTA